MPAEPTRRSFHWSTAGGAATLLVLTLCCALTLWLGVQHGLREGTLATVFNIGTILAAAAIALSLATVPAIAAALYVSEFLDGSRRQAAKVAIELVAAIPLLVWALLAWDRLVAGPSLPVLGGFLFLIALPQLATLSDEALRTVPVAARRTAQSLGATDWQTTWRVVVPAARVGLARALTLTFARLLAEAAALLWIVNWSRRSAQPPGAGDTPGQDLLALGAALATFGFLVSVVVRWLAERASRTTS